MNNFPPIQQIPHVTIRKLNSTSLASVETSNNYSPKPININEQMGGNKNHTKRAEGKVILGSIQSTKHKKKFLIEESSLHNQSASKYYQIRESLDEDKLNRFKSYKD